MLKLWFPQILTQPVSTASSVATSPARSLQEASGSTPPHKHRDQLHIPVKVRTYIPDFLLLIHINISPPHQHHKFYKNLPFMKITLLFIFQKRRLSWTGTDSPTPSPIPLKSPHISTGENRVKSDCREGGPSSSPSLAADANQSLAHAASSSQLTDDKNDGKDGDGKEPVKVSKYQAGQSSKPSLTWVHVAPILSPRNTCLSHDALTASRRLSPATQDSSISSTTPYKHPKNVKKPIRCQSQPVAGQQSERGTTEATPGESQSPPVTLKPLPGACPTSLKT